MAEAKIIMFVLNLIGYSTLGWALLEVAGDVRGWVVWGFGCIFAIYKLVEFQQGVVKRRQEQKTRDLEIRIKEIELEERELTLKRNRNIK